MSAPSDQASAEPSFKPYRLLAFGGSAGGIPALIDILSRLPATFPIPIVVVQHLSDHFESQLPAVLGFGAKLQCKWADDGELPQPGFVYVARRGADLEMSNRGSLLRVATAKPRLGRPCIDAFLMSMARVLGSQSIAVILSGLLHDGTAGVAGVRRRGGATMAQNLKQARWSEMPSSAFDIGRADILMTSCQIAAAVEILAALGVPEARAPDQPWKNIGRDREAVSAA
jgi:two-component system, chemotaxis family, protein-glutamate methylesterase/glutaminase